MIPQFYEFYCPTKIISGVNAINNLGYELIRLNIKNPALFTDENLNSLGHIKTICNILDTWNIPLIIKDVPIDSSVTLVNKYAALYKEYQCDGIIALGGGSVIDMAKGVNLLISKGIDDLLELQGANFIIGKLSPFIAIPTTVGSGSEVTKVFISSYTQEKLKMEFLSESIIPDVAILDPKFTTTLPKINLAASAIDALTQAIEAYTCLQKNPISDAFSMSAISLISNNIIDAVTKDDNEINRIALANASLCSGIALSNSMVGIAHAISHALGAICHIAHGNALASILIPCMKHNKISLHNLYGKLLLPIAGEEVYARTEKENRANITISLLKSLLANLHQYTNIPINLKQLRVDPKLFSDIADLALDDGTIITERSHINKDIIISILKQAY